ncbi:MAG TPA: TetR family transcriptional regulator, partial [Gaiellaceae bacterium]|nr:TetR family transcriptional regulator [Gaiellaceae bacterium]
VYTVYSNVYSVDSGAMPRLDRDAVLHAGLALADEGGLDAVTFRRVAERLGVTPMALYRHVESKEDLLDGMADLLYAELDIPDASGDWWSELAALARSTRRVLLRHPAAAQLFARPLAGPNSVRLGEALRGTLERAGFFPHEVDELHEQLTQMVFALVVPELHPGPKRGRRARDAAFERGIELLHAGLLWRLGRQ